MDPRRSNMSVAIGVKGKAAKGAVKGTQKPKKKKVKKDA